MRIRNPAGHWSEFSPFSLTVITLMSDTQPSPLPISLPSTPYVKMDEGAGKSTFPHFFQSDLVRRGLSYLVTTSPTQLANLGGKKRGRIKAREYGACVVWSILGTGLIYLIFLLLHPFSPFSRPNAKVSIHGVELDFFATTP